MTDAHHALRRFVRTVAWHRRLLAAGFAAAAVALSIQAASPAPPERVDVVVAARDLSGGSVLTADDLATQPLPPDAIPMGVVKAADAIGHVLAGPVRAGEPITDRRLVGAELLAGWGPDLVATPVRLADPAAVAHLRHGDRIDLLATAADGAAGTAVIAEAVPVLALPAADDDSLASNDALLLVGASPTQATDLADAAVTSRLSFTFTRP